MFAEVGKPLTPNRKHHSSNPFRRTLRDRKHTSQRHKGEAGKPYLNHLIEAAYLVASAPAEPDSDMIAAAVLHDVIEDAGVTA